MDRRRLLSRLKDAFIPIVPTLWRLNTQISSSGVYQTGSQYSFAALSGYIPMTAGTIVKRISNNTDADGHTFTIWLHQLKTNSDSQQYWIGRTAMQQGQEITIDSQCTYVRFVCAYPSSLGIAMTQEAIDANFAVSKKEV